MSADLLRGALVRLAAPDPETDAEAFARWSRDSEYARLQDSDPARPRPAQYYRDQAAEAVEPDAYAFRIWRLAEGHAAQSASVKPTAEPSAPIGHVSLWVVWPHRDAWLGIGIGARECWGQGYGTDALRVAVRYAFDELGLWRVSLSVLGTNARALRAYAKAGFVEEGRARGQNCYDGARVDEVFMGLLRADWERGR